MNTIAVLPSNWRTLRSWALIDLRRELRLASKEMEERNDLSTAATMHRALADLDDFLAPRLSGTPAAEEWEAASREAERDQMQRESEGFPGVPYWLAPAAA